tara:strand:+ start:411 stop:638 length:228 start_codon:yes stop_codon:yes gene_type:complete
MTKNKKSTFTAEDLVVGIMTTIILVGLFALGWQLALSVLILGPILAPFMLTSASRNADSTVIEHYRDWSNPDNRS